MTKDNDEGSVTVKKEVRIPWHAAITASEMVAHNDAALLVICAIQWPPHPSPSPLLPSIAAVAVVPLAQPSVSFVFPSLLLLPPHLCAAESPRPTYLIQQKCRIAGLKGRFPNPLYCYLLLIFWAKWVIDGLFLLQRSKLSLIAIDFQG